MGSVKEGVQLSQQDEISYCLKENPELALKRYGFCIIPAAVSKQQVDACRKYCIENKEVNEIVSNNSSLSFSAPIISDIPFHENTVEKLMDIHGGQYLMYPNYTIRKNLYISWHVDIAFQKAVDGVNDVSDFLQCVVYFQDNDVDAGGGLSVIPGSHKRRLINGEYMVPAQYLNVFGSEYTVPNKAGDMVIFDSRLLHRSSGGSDISQDDRFGVFWTTSKPSEKSGELLRYLREWRMEKNEGGCDKLHQRVLDMASLDYPNSFSHQAIKMMGQQKVKMCFLEEEVEPCQ